MPTSNDLLDLIIQINLYLKYKNLQPETKAALRRLRDSAIRMMAQLAGIDPSTFWKAAPKRYSRAAADLRQIEKSLKSDAKAINDFAELLRIVGQLLRIFA